MIPSFGGFNDLAHADRGISSGSHTLVYAIVHRFRTLVLSKVGQGLAYPDQKCLPIFLACLGLPTKEHLMRS